MTEPVKVLSFPAPKRKCGWQKGRKRGPRTAPDPVQALETPPEQVATRSRDGRRWIREIARNQKPQTMLEVRLDTLTRDELVGLASYLLVSIERLVDNHKAELLALIGVRNEGG